MWFNGPLEMFQGGNGQTDVGHLCSKLGNDDVVNLISELYNLNTQVNYLHKKRKQKDLAEGIGVVPAKYLLKVKLEIFSQLWSAREGSIIRTLM